MRKLSSLLLIVLIFSSSFAFAKTEVEKEIERRQKQEEKAQKKRDKLLEKLEKANGDKEKDELKQDLTELGKVNSYYEQQDQILRENSEETEEKKPWFNFGNDSKKKRKEQGSKSSKKEQSEIEELRAELKANEEQALNFIFQSQDKEDDLASAENFFSKSEKEQLLELWRATLARNRTIQFIIKSLSTDPENYEKNNAVMQVLSRALFVPFYAVSAISQNSLIDGGSAVGARVIGDVINANKEKKDKTNQVTRTDLIVLFMLVDEVAERLRNSYYDYKETKIEKELLSYELKAAQIDLNKAFELEEEGKEQSTYFSKMIVRDLERKLRENKLNYKNSMRKIVELAGADAVSNVEMLIELEIDESLESILGV